MAEETNPYKPAVDVTKGLSDGVPFPSLRDEKLLDDLIGLVKTRTAVPTGVPRKFSEQIQLVVTGGAASLYVYDTQSNLWRSATLIST